LQNESEVTGSLTAKPGESDPNTDGRAARERVIVVGFHQDDDGHWIARLSCGHTQHLRHQPPWQHRAWVLDEARRTRQIGQPFPCGWCAALPSAR
jgi:hypothetical protein